METPVRSARRESAPLRSTLVAIGLTIFGLLGAAIATLPAVLVDPMLAKGVAAASIEGQTLYMILNFVGMALAGAIYLAATGRGWSYVDFRLPSTTGWIYVLVGMGASIAFLFVVNIVVQLLSLPAAESEVVAIVGQDQTMILIMIGIVVFFNAPAEEFLFRNVVQKRLYEAFTRMQSVLLASTIFALVHFPMYVALADSIAATLTSLAIMFGGAIIFGTLYVKTRNLVVPIAAHAALNAFQFGVLYLAIEYNVEGVGTSPSAIVGILPSLPP
ncbi:CPBP family intramembrane glutamic endopeptidase [Natrinema halophilum]|uniref:CPBP family intramembrane metalloprotease n=1 Tax=Natrinema halophilum TaxID=1699371 RepID=A0A7D5GLH7_9EURY|nr:type II CAAX endopeptidase family protein [Natrinema halophilum]QLG49910.1 CPBP family intramembrane metalloprotease [Natrinema halophilum]